MSHPCITTSPHCPKQRGWVAPGEKPQKSSAGGRGVGMGSSWQREAALVGGGTASGGRPEHCGQSDSPRAGAERSRPGGWGQGTGMCCFIASSPPLTPPRMVEEVPTLHWLMEMERNPHGQPQLPLQSLLPAQPRGWVGSKRGESGPGGLDGEHGLVGDEAFGSASRGVGGGTEPQRRRSKVVSVEFSLIFLCF